MPAHRHIALALLLAACTVRVQHAHVEPDLKPQPRGEVSHWTLRYVEFAPNEIRWTIAIWWCEYVDTGAALAPFGACHRTERRFRVQAGSGWNLDSAMRETLRLAMTDARQDIGQPVGDVDGWAAVCIWWMGDPALRAVFPTIVCGAPEQLR